MSLAVFVGHVYKKAMIIGDNRFCSWLFRM